MLRCLEGGRRRQGDKRVVILAAILYPIVKTIVDQAQSAEQTKAAKRQAAAEEARLKLERMGIINNASAGG